jgi:hypothetical protein
VVTGVATWSDDTGGPTPAQQRGGHVPSGGKVGGLHAREQMARRLGGYRWLVVRRLILALRRRSSNMRGGARSEGTAQPHKGDEMARGVCRGGQALQQLVGNRTDWTGCGSGGLHDGDRTHATGDWGRIP